MPVHILTGLLPWLLFNIILLFTGVSGSEPTVYSSAGELVSLPCDLHGSFDCSSTTWLRSSVGSKGSIELVAKGAVKDKDQQIARRLSVGTDCSLHIKNLTTADAGRYNCRLYLSHEDYKDVSVYLSILNIFESSPVTELKIGSSVTLVCKLHSPGSCGKSVRVSWVSETGVPLQGNMHKLSESECSSSLTVTIERSDPNMKWRCQLTVQGQLKASHSYATSFPGVSGSELTVYSSAGELVTLPCNLHSSFNCPSITWLRSSVGSEESIELVVDEAVKAKDQQLDRRLSVETDCSLHINDLTTADAGRYNCQLNRNGKDYTDVSFINLSILNIFASSPNTELKIGSTVTLVCELHNHRSCGKSVRVIWVSETGAPLQGNRYKLSESECSSSLTVILEHSDRNMKWICQLTVEGKLKASHSYTTIFPAVSGSEPTVYSSAGELVSHSYTTISPGVSGSEPTVYSSAGELVSHSYTTSFTDKITRDVWIGSGVAICVAVVLIVILIMICRRRTVQRKTAHNPVSQSHTVTDQNKGESEDTVTYAVVNPSAGGKRKQDQESAVLETEYAIIKTSQKSNKP